METQKRLISADVAKEMIVNHANEFSDVLNRREKALLIGGGTSCIDKCPTVDAVCVVRCKDCKHFNMRRMQCENDEISTDNEGGADYSINFYLDDFCSYGERRNNETEEPV